MKRAIAVIPLAFALVVASMGTTGSAASPPRVKVLCWNNHFPNHGPADIRSTPRKCSLYRDGYDFEAAGAVHMRKLKWRHWGDRAALAKGEFAQPMDIDDPWKPVKVRLKRQIKRCGRIVYSKAIFLFAGSRTSFRIWTC